jgi:hypothetical protein
MKPRPAPELASRIWAVQIAEFAVKLCEMDGLSNYSDEKFRAKFAFVFDLLVDADLQLQNLPAKITAAARNSP